MSFSYIALFSWPVIAYALFQRSGPAAAIAAAIVGGYLLLPSKPVINLPLVPALDKNTIPMLAALALALTLSRGATTAPLPGWIPRVGWARLALLSLILGAFVTTALNGSGFSFGPRSLPGLRPYDAFSNILTTFTMLMPFFLARKYMARPEDHAALLTVVAIAALIYTLPTLYEVRMSPQLNKMIYGYFPHDWAQHKRDGGFRPVVFLHHSLWLAIFLACGCLAALTRARVLDGPQRTKWLAAAGVILVTLVLSKNLGALLIVITLAPVVMFLKRRTQLIVAAVIAASVLAYPMLRGADLVPTETALSMAQKISPARAGSLGYRFLNEDILLEKANQKPLFGWGGWGRARVFNAKGEDLSTTDGYWILTIGEGGWVRYLAEFGLLTGAIILLAWRATRYDVGPATVGLGLVLSANLLDVIPNAGITPLTWLMAGAMLGRLELGRITDSDQTTASQQMRPTRRTNYSRSRPNPKARRDADATAPRGSRRKTRLQ